MAKRDLKNLLAELRSDKAPRLLLVFGDDLQVEEACKAIVDELVPAERRGFNFERFDGRTAAWEEIEGSLRTPPFFPGKKLLWIENAPYFFSREQKGEAGEKILDLWRDGKKDAAAKLLIDLLVVEGWSQDQWANLTSAQPLVDLLGAEDESEAVGALAAYCKSRDYDLSRRKGAEDHRLGAFLDVAPPEWSFLLLTASQVDRRTRLFKRFDESGTVLFLGVERDKSGRLSRESLVDFVGRRIAQSGKNIEPQAREMILARAGEDLRELRQEIDKLLLFVGEEGTIRVADVAAVMTDHSEGWVFDLTRALGERNAALALDELARLMAQGEPALKILGAIAAEVRRLLAARYLQTTELARIWKRGMRYEQFQQTVLRQGAPLLTRNPYADYMCFQRAELFSLAELRAHMERLFDADYRLKSSGAQPRLVLERLILAMCRRARKEPQRGQAAMLA